MQSSHDIPLGRVSSARSAFSRVAKKISTACRLSTSRPRDGTLLQKYVLGTTNGTARHGGNDNNVKQKPSLLCFSAFGIIIFLAKEKKYGNETRRDEKRRDETQDQSAGNKTFVAATKAVLVPGTCQRTRGSAKVQKMERKLKVQPVMVYR